MNNTVGYFLTHTGVGTIGLLLGVFFLWTLEDTAFSSPETSCVNRCIHAHPQWGEPDCSENENFYIVGKKCHAIQNECYLECNPAWGQPAPERFIPTPYQIKNQWRQENVCSPEIMKMPLELLPGDQLIMPGWKGQCECLNGKLIIAPCGHKKASCDQVCDAAFTF
ncbi:MAG: hypothetical protein HQM14_08400 [SAR324 cluster bacterium]|nr:hypothetical protein [SAR324 cluster bacterium]